MSIPHKRFYFVRHGETEWNKRRIYMGQEDIPLNHTGIKQAHSIAGIIQQEPIKRIITSPLRRAHETAQILNQTLNVPLVVLDELQESCLGVAQGQSHSDGDIIERWIKGGELSGGELHAHFTVRILQGLGKALSYGDNSLIVSHGGVYRALSIVMQWQEIYLHNCSAVLHIPPVRHDLPWMLVNLSDH